MHNYFFKDLGYCNSLDKTSVLNFIFIYNSVLGTMGQYGNHVVTSCPLPTKLLHNHKHKINVFYKMGRKHLWLSTSYPPPCKLVIFPKFTLL